MPVIVPTTPVSRRLLLIGAVLTSLAAPASASAALPCDLPGPADATTTKTLEVSGSLPAALEGSYVYIPFDVPTGTAVPAGTAFTGEAAPTASGAAPPMTVSTAAAETTGSTEEREGIGSLPDRAPTGSTPRTDRPIGSTAGTGATGLVWTRTTT